MSYVVRYRIKTVSHSGATYDRVYLRGPQWLDLAEACLPASDRDADTYCVGLDYVEPFAEVEDAVAAALRLRGEVCFVTADGRGRRIVELSRAG